jgi:Mlc titration factor MtfA (ptsG expression regulator)
MANPYGAWLILLLGAIAASACLIIVTRARRRRRRAAPLPAAWATMLDGIVARYPGLPGTLRRELQGRVNEFIADKQIIGCDGLEVDDAMRVTIAANACLLLLNRNVATFPNVQTILIYPGAFIAKFEEQEDWLQHDVTEIRAGESWEGGPLILAWDEICTDTQAGSSHNVILHEFAHKLDEQNPDGEGFPPLADGSVQAEWSRVMHAEFQALKDAAARGDDGLLDPYGADSPAEFFAVVTETFFAQPGPLRTRHPALYAALRSCYRVDPWSWAPRH